MKHSPLINKIPHILHGADYNPEQWLGHPEVFQEDLRMMKLANCNIMSVGIFSWNMLENQESHITFDWMDKVIDGLYANGVSVILATPSGARPHWLAEKYPEVLRTNQHGVKDLFGNRHNHCFTSPVYREKVANINAALVERYGTHPAIAAWHVSNEYNGECYCPLCKKAFQDYLKDKYKDLETLNYKWWTAFWSHSYTSWEQIEPPMIHGEQLLHGLNLDWKRFVTHQTIDFYKHEIKVLKEKAPHIPATTNFMGTFPGLDYWEFAKALDFVSNDIYPAWHQTEDLPTASFAAFTHDLTRSLNGGKPFMLMESTPSLTNWSNTNRPKKPNMHILSSIQAIAHGSDTVQYFQWRKSRGSSEKFHGAVVGHDGHENTRVFKDVANLGNILTKLDGVVGTSNKAETALLFDWENMWAINGAAGFSMSHKDYIETVHCHYHSLWEQNIPVDVINENSEFEGYKLIILPMMHMIRPGVAERLEKYVAAGGTIVTTYWSGYVDETDLCFLGGMPGPLRKLLGIWSEEVDCLLEGEKNTVIPADPFLSKEYDAVDTCELIHAETAKVLAAFGSDFYAGRPALTVNSFGKGKAYYVAFRNTEDFHPDFYRKLRGDLGIERSVDMDTPPGVSVQKRSDGESDYLFVMNFNKEPVRVDLSGLGYIDAVTGERVYGELVLEGYGCKVLGVG